MCRLVAYLGEEVLLEDVIVKPVNSLVKQSLKAKETDMPTNGDGFGLSWYTPSISVEPALFTSIQPAWNDRNLLHLASKIKAPCFLSHVRAATMGGVTQYNCHPFLFNQWSFMHNGGIHDFKLVKRHLCHLLDDDIYMDILGESDSEHAFGLLLQHAKGKNVSDMRVAKDIVHATIAQINELVVTHTDDAEASNLNFVISDGKRLFATRYNSKNETLGRSLHYAYGDAYIEIDGKYHIAPSKGKPRCVLIASERLTCFHADWKMVPQNHLLSVDETMHIELEQIN